MYVYETIQCVNFPCLDVKHGNFSVAQIQIDPQKITAFLISEAAPADITDAYYNGKDALFAKTTIQAFQDAGANVNSMQDILNLGVYCTTAVKCGKTGYGIQSDTIKTCSFLLEKEISLFPNVKVFHQSGERNCQAKQPGTGHPRRINLQDSRSGLLFSRKASFAILYASRTFFLH